jgi:hypothetical protein
MFLNLLILAKSYLLNKLFLQLFVLFWFWVGLFIIFFSSDPYFLEEGLYNNIKFTCLYGKLAAYIFCIYVTINILL